MRRLFTLTIMILIMASMTYALTGYEVTSVKIDGFELDSDSIHVETGQQIAVEVLVRCTNSDPEDLKLEARIGGYEYESIHASTGLFTAVSSASGPALYRHSLVLDIPEDMDTSDKDYTLTIRVMDKKDFRDYTYDLFVSEPRNKVKIQDVMLSPTTTVKAGSPLMVKVRIENFGEVQQKDVKVVAEIKELGVSARTYVDELPAYGEEDSVATAGTIFLNIPEDARTGDYKVEVSAFYGGRSKYYYATHETEYINIDGISATPTKSDALISVTSSVLTKAEKLSTAKIMITNLGTDFREYTIEVGETMPWAELKEAEEGITVGPGEVGELSVTIMPTIRGSYTLPITIYEDGTEVKRANVAVSISKSGIASSTGWVLGIGGALVVVVILGLVLSSFYGNRIGKDDIGDSIDRESERGQVDENGPIRRLK